MKISLLIAAGALVTAGSAVAQEPPPAPAPAQAQPGAQTAPQASADVTDDEVDRFAQAALKVEEIAADQAITQEQKQAAMANAVQETGLEPQRFNEIAVATQTDQELNERIQVAAANHAGGAHRQ